ncbi:MAG TPA: hypothetical protein VF119_08015, partial [Candidatus Limnocylindrales bacterium]
MVRPRTGFDAVVLGDGTVLAVGDDFACFPGPAAPGSERAERYDPATDAWAEVPSLNKPRKEPATVVRPDGSALVIGGVNDVEEAYSSTKRFDPASGAWTDGPLMELGRGAPLADTLPDGRVFVIGETRAGSTSEILDPTSNTWKATASVRSGAGVDAIVGLGDNSVLANGSVDRGDTESPP